MAIQECSRMWSIFHVGNVGAPESRMPTTLNTESTRPPALEHCARQSMAHCTAASVGRPRAHDPRAGHSRRFSGAAHHMAVFTPPHGRVRRWRSGLQGPMWDEVQGKRSIDYMMPALMTNSKPPMRVAGRATPPLLPPPPPLSVYLQLRRRAV